MVESIRRILAAAKFDARHRLNCHVPLSFPHLPGDREDGLDVERGEKDEDDCEGVGTDAFVAEEAES